MSEDSFCWNEYLFVPGGDLAQQRMRPFLVFCDSLKWNGYHIAFKNHFINDRGEVIVPVIALAATVAGDARWVILPVP